MKSKIYLKEKAVHGTILIPIAIHRLSYGPNVGNFFYLHWHYEFEFIIVLKGAMVYTIEDREYCIKSGEGLFIPSNALHAARSYKGMPCEASVVLFHPNLFGYNAKLASYSKFVYPIINGDIEFEKLLKRETKWQKSVLELLREISKLRYEDIAENELFLKSRIFGIWDICYKNSKIISNYKKKKDYELKRIQPILDYIHNNYAEEISLSSLAKIIPMSEGYFCQAFKEIMNISPIAYVIRYRILKSCTLLMTTDSKIADIARRVGFNNISYFNREFKKAIGCSPSKYIY